MDTKPMIEIYNVSKLYRTGALGGKTLKGDLQSWWARVRNRPDPNLIIGNSQRKIGERFLALNDLNLQINEGEAIGIIGSNGAGKSTLLKIISRITTPTSGKIVLNGRVASMLEVGTGFHPELTGRENIYMNGAILGMTKKEIDSKLEDIIEFSEVREFIDTPVKRYSSGMYVKLAFSVAAHLNSEILIMDEVLAVGDMAFQRKCLEKMRTDSTQNNKTILYVSHNMTTIRQLCDRCIVLDEGKIIFDGDVEEAIGIYLNDSVEAYSANLDLSNNRMEHLPKNILGKITNIQFLDRDKAVINYGEKIRLAIKINTYSKLTDLGVRLEVRSKSGISVGISKINSIGDAEAGSVINLEVVLNWSGLVPGDYTLCLVLHSINEHGSFFDIDAIFPACIFKIIDPQGKIDIQWQARNWGYVNFEDIQIERLTSLSRMKG